MKGTAEQIAFNRPVVTSPTCDDGDKSVWSYWFSPDTQVISEYFRIAINSIDDKIEIYSLQDGDDYFDYTFTIQVYLLTRQIGELELIV